MKKILTFILLMLFTVTLVGCKKNNLEITGPDTVEQGTSIKLDVNYDKKDKVIWSSTNDYVATVVDGVVIGNKIGTVTISAVVEEGRKTFVARKEITVVHPVVEVTISGKNILEVGEETVYTVNVSKLLEDKVTIRSSDLEILTIDQEGNARALKPGIAYVIATLYDEETKFKVEIKEKEKVNYQIVIDGPNKVNVGETIKLNITSTPTTDVIYSSSDEMIAYVDSEGNVIGVKEGTVTITVISKDNSESKSTFTIEVIDIKPANITLVGETNIVMGHHSFIEANITGDTTKEVIWTSSNEMVATCYQGIVLGLTPGKTTITATSVVDKNVKGTIEITVSKYEAQDPSKEDLERVNSILNSMTLSQKVGQMFIVGFSGTSLNSSLQNAIKNYNMGNVIYLANNVSNASTLTALSNNIQNAFVSSNSVPGFISIDQEGGRVARLVNGGTHFISQMAMGATNNYNNTYLEGKAIGEELISYGINMNFAPVLDVNNNPDNPIIGIRSYSDNPILASLYGKNMFKGLQESNVIGCSKHFPGHGNTSVDSHYGLPTITSSKEELYKTELAPFISSISNGIDSIMTTHIIFSAIDPNYPATLSSKVLTELLREELGYEGLIVTDGMGMAAITKYFGTPSQTGVQAVKAGVDILTYTSINEPIEAHQAIIEAVRKGEITEERINESVRRILLAKLEYGILDNYIKQDINRTEMLKEHEELNLRFAMESLTLAKGEFNGLDSTKSTLIISPTTTWDLGSNLANNSFGCYAANYLKQNGHTKCDYSVVSTNITSTESTNILNALNKYDQIVVAFSNVKTSNYSKSAAFIKQLTSKHNNVIVIALDTPYDIIAYDQNVKNYICVYGYQKATVIALSKYLNGEFEAVGVSPINEDNYK